MKLHHSLLKSIVFSWAEVQENDPGHLGDKMFILALHLTDKVPNHEEDEFVIVRVRSGFWVPESGDKRVIFTQFTECIVYVYDSLISLQTAFTEGIWQIKNAPPLRTHHATVMDFLEDYLVPKYTFANHPGFLRQWEITE